MSGIREIGQRLYTPRELAELGVLSLVTQWKLRKSGRLGAYRFGKKILYGQKHLDDYFAAHDSSKAA